MHLNLCKAVNFSAFKVSLEFTLFQTWYIMSYLSLFTHSIDKPIISLRYWLELKSYTSGWGLFMGSIWWMVMGGGFIFWGVIGRREGRLVLFFFLLFL